MVIRSPSAVYKCVIPVKKVIAPSGAIYHSLFREPTKGTQALPFPAWPEIDDPDQPCCLPTLLRAVYFSQRHGGDIMDIGRRVLARIFHKKAQTSCKSLIEWHV
jgi:hypothetical protein